MLINYLKKNVLMQNKLGSSNSFFKKIGLIVNFKTSLLSADVTLYLLTLFDAPNVILCITLASFSYEISMHHFSGSNLHFLTFQEIRREPSTFENRRKTRVAIGERLVKFCKQHDNLPST